MRGFRRLQITVAGRWYVTLTILLGVAALVSGNNLVYLVESLLLSGLILSGVLAEQVISGVFVQVYRQPASAGDKALNRDLIRVKNLKRRTLFCIEIGEWREGKFTTLGFIPSLAPLASVTVRSRQRFGRRGVHRWDAIAIATSYPFGFARKLRFLRAPGQRLVWPEDLSNKARRNGSETDKHSLAGGPKIVDGEVRAKNVEDDYRQVVWTLSGKGIEPLVRVRRAELRDPAITLDTDCPEGEDFERRVSSAAAAFHAVDSENGSLVIKGPKGKARFVGRTKALDQLALVEGQKRAAS